MLRRDLNFTKGERFGRLTVVEETEPLSRGGRRYRCDCDCGGTTVAVASNMARAIWNSCGCLKAEAARENGKKNTASTRYLTFLGHTLTLGQWAERTGLRKGTIRARLTHGWSEERTLTEPLYERKGDASCESR